LHLSRSWNGQDQARSCPTAWVNPRGQTEQTQAVSEQQPKIPETTLILLFQKSNILFKNTQTTKIAPKGLLTGYQGEDIGGATQSRTGLDGFAIRCITALLSRQNQIEQV
jgi:hypothetical protein